MKTLGPLLLALTTLALTDTKAALLINFDNQAVFDTEFPSSGRGSVGASSSASLLTSPSRVDLHAQQSTGEGVAARMTIYSVAENADLDFVSSEKTLTFNNLQLSTGSGTGYDAQFGIFNANTGKSILSLSTKPTSGVYMQLNRVSGRLEFYQIANQTTTLLASWTGSGLINFTSISMTLDGDSWSMNAITSGGTVLNNANADASSAFLGVYKTDYTSAVWNGNYYIGLQDDVSTSTDATRFADLKIGSIAAVPEPASVSLLVAGGLGLVLARFRRLSNRGGQISKRAI